MKFKQKLLRGQGDQREFEFSLKVWGKSKAKTRLCVGKHQDSHAPPYLLFWAGQQRPNVKKVFSRKLTTVIRPTSISKATAASVSLTVTHHFAGLGSTSLCLETFPELP